MIWEIYQVHYGHISRYRAVRYDEEMKMITKEKTFNSRVEAEMYVMDFKMKQKSLTELNYDGNENRGRYGEDESI